MSLKNSSSQEESSSSVNVTVHVDVPKIVKYCAVAGIAIVGIIFGSRCIKNLLEEGFFDHREG